MERKTEIQGHLLALFTIFIWGTTFVSTKILLRVAAPVEILFLRFGLGFLVLLAIYPHRLKLTEKKQELFFVAAGLCGVTLYFLLENIALTFTLAANVGVIVSITPFFTAVLAHWFLDGEKIKIRFVIGFLIAITGVFLIGFNGISNLQLNPLGDILAILAAFVWAVYSILIRKINSFHYHTIQITRRVFFYGLVLMIPALFIFGFQPDIDQLMQPVNMFYLLFLGLGASALCFVTWNSAVKLLGVVRTTVYIYMIPVITVTTSIIILQEKITALAVVGTVLTLAGLLISEGSAKPGDT